MTTRRRRHGQHTWRGAATIALAALASGESAIVSPWRAPQHLSADFRPRTAFGQDAALTWVKAGGLGLAIRMEPAVGLRSLRHLATETEFVSTEPDRPALWEIELRKRDGSVITLPSADADAAELPSAADGGPVTMRWQTDVGVSVTVTVEWDEGRAFTRWRIRVDNANTGLGIWRVAFPILPGLGYAGRTDVATSYLHRNLSDRVTSPLWSWQFVPITCGRATLYVATHDTRHNHRQLTFEPGKELRITALPPDMGKPGGSYVQDYDTVIGVVEGDWYDAAQVYREWGLKQTWCRRGPVARWEGLPDGFRDPAIWLTAMSPLTKQPKAVVDTMLDAKRFFGVPVGVHWYNWYRRPFMPRLFPPRKGVVEQIRRAQAEGLTVMPYINMLYWCKARRNPDEPWLEFERARAGLCTPMADAGLGRVVDGHYLVYVGRHLMAPMCRYAAFWQDYLASMVSQVRRELGVSCIYLDQAASWPRWPCFSKAHGHAGGGGPSWADGMARMIPKLRAAAGQGAAFAGEGVYEGYLDQIELDLTGYWRGADHRVPIYETVYGDHTLTFTSMSNRGDDTCLAYRIGTAFLFGSRWRIGTWFLDPRRREIAEFMERLAVLRGKLGAFLDCGLMIRPPAWARRPATVVSEKWPLGKRDKPVAVALPALERAAWRGDGGAVAIVVVNFDRAGHTAKIDWPTQFRGRAVRLLRSGPEAALDVQHQTVELDVPGRDAVALVVSEDE